MQNEYLLALPDSLGWNKVMSPKKPYVLHYHAHPTYSDYPAVNISQQQARRYCQWLQDRVMEDLVAKNSSIEKIIVRLPSEEEWIKAARKGLSEYAIYPWPEEGIRKERPEKYRGLIQANVNLGYGYNAVAATQRNQNNVITTRVKSYWPNPIGLWNMSGNVAEWLEETGRTKGGSWNLPPYQAQIDVAGYYDGDSNARADIGFRYVIEVISVKNRKPVEGFKARPGNFLIVKVRDSLYAQTTELSNREYLQFLLENDAPELKIDHSGWLRYFPYAHYTMYGSHSAYYDRPVVNVSYESAVKYCEWLTSKYNAMPGRKFEKVVFRLPTQEEWEWAAKGGRFGPFPWGGPYIKNSKGCYLANFSPREEKYLAKNDTGGYYYRYPNNDLSISRGVDGRIIPAEVFSYFPNNYGLYNCSGNVAEMVSEKGISRGGSWTSTAEYISISSFETYTSPRPDLGFRVFMEVIQKYD